MARPPIQYNATLVERIDMTSHLAIFRVKPDSEAYPFIPGQFTVLGLKQGEPTVADYEGGTTVDEADKMLRRSYSICSSSQQTDVIEIYTSLLEKGELTPRLFNLKPGARLYVGERARGKLTLDGIPEEANVLLVATGTGLGPYVSMIRSYAGQLPVRRVGIIQGSRHSSGLGYREELTGYAAREDKLVYLPVVSRPESDPDWHGATGRVQNWLDEPDFSERFGFHLQPGSTHVFLCGNPVMIEETTALLTARGFTPDARAIAGDLHLEKYW